MILRLLKRLGYENADDAIEFVMAGIGIVPPLLMLSGFVFAGAATLMFLILLLAAVGMHTQPPPAPSEENVDKKDKTPLL